MRFIAAEDRRMRATGFSIFVVVCLATCAQLVAEDPVTAEQAIRKAVASYVDAYNKGDAKALAELWTDGAVYANPLTGEQTIGRDAIEKLFAGVFAGDKGTQLKAATSEVRFVSPLVAIETGIATVTDPSGLSQTSEYSAVYVKSDGRWLIDRVSEEEPPVVNSNYDHLKELEWMVGKWIDKDVAATVKTECNWTKNRNFLVRSFTILSGERVDLAGIQMVGWDPATKNIRSWVFDSNGGFGEGTWTRKDNSWHVQTSGTTQDGRKMSSVNILKRLSDDQFTWQIVNTQVGDELLPNLDEVVVVRDASE
jgi:uncharacterized protein (TIGR02246 family)